MLFASMAAAAGACHRLRCLFRARQFDGRRRFHADTAQQFSHTAAFERLLAAAARRGVAARSVAVYARFMLHISLPAFNAQIDAINARPCAYR